MGSEPTQADKISQDIGQPNQEARSEDGNNVPLPHEDVKPTLHSPLPWNYWELGDRFGVSDSYDEGLILDDDVKNWNHPFAEQQKANAAFIVRAVNCHEEITDLLQQTLLVINDIKEKDCTPVYYAWVSNMNKRIKAALARAKGESNV